MEIEIEYPLGYASSGDSLFHSFVYSFIHTEHLYSASSRELLRGAPDSSTAKKSSLKLRKNAGDKALGKFRDTGTNTSESSEMILVLVIYTDISNIS